VLGIRQDTTKKGTTVTNKYQKNTPKTSSGPGLAVPDEVTITMGEIAEPSPRSHGQDRRHHPGSAAKLACWAGLTPTHHESDTHVRRGRLTKQGSRLVRWAAIESVKTISKGTPIGILRERVADRRGSNIGSVAAATRQLEFVRYTLRDSHVRAVEHLPMVA